MIPPMGKVSLPCYEGFTKFLVWPKHHAVSTCTCKQTLSTILYFKVKSYYGLMAKEPIPPPAHSGNNVVLPYYPGCLYVAYQAEDGKSVSFQINL